MRNRFASILTAGVMTAMSLGAVQPIAAPVPGFEELYEAVLVACTPPLGTPPACEAAINAYSAALVAAGIDPAVALQSFTELRAEVRARGGGDVIDALFEELLPDSGAVGGNEASPV
mgnify:CR=1 FL=1